MASKSDYLENAIINAVLRNTSYTSPTTVYVGLFTTAPSDSGPGTEVTGNAYARTAATFNAPSGGSTSNSATITFPTPTPSGWGTIVGWGIFDASTAGNMLYWSPQTPNKLVSASDTVQFDAGNIVVNED